MNVTQEHENALPVYKKKKVLPPPSHELSLLIEYSIFVDSFILDSMI